MDSLYLDIGRAGCNKSGETICGDFFYLIQQPQQTTAVLSDGLGSGVKANILSTLTSKIISTLLSRGMPIDDCVQTVASTLPMCSVRRLAYATFTALKIQNGLAYLAQYDNPEVIFLRQGQAYQYQKSVYFIGEKEIHESHVPLQEDDTLVLMTDGVTNAGIGKQQPHGWLRQDVIELLKRCYTPDVSAQQLAATVVNAAMTLCLDEPDDDITALVFRLRRRQAVNLIVGPPERRDEDDRIFKLFFAKTGLHVVCGGTTARAVGKYLQKPVVPLSETLTQEVPAMARIEGVDLVTEGVITLQHVAQLLRAVQENGLQILNLHQRDGASALARMLLEQASDVNFFLGMAINPAHDALAIDVQEKHAAVNEIAQILGEMGKNVKCSLC